MVGWDSGVGSQAETDCLTLCQAPCLFKNPQQDPVQIDGRLEAC